MTNPSNLTNTVVVYEGEPGTRLSRAGLTVVGCSHDELVPTVHAQVGAGARRVELCGGLGIADAAAVAEAVGERARVGLNRYAFESLELVAAYQAAFATGDVRPAAFLFPAASPTDERVSHADGLFVPVRDLVHAEALGCELADEVGIVELYAGLGATHASAVLRGSGGRLPVGVVGFELPR